MSTQRLPAAPPASTVDRLLGRIESEYREMPGLQLTAPQAARLLSIQVQVCALLLDRLIDAGVLRRGQRGHYVLATDR